MVAVLLSSWREPEPTYNGRRLSEWLQMSRLGPSQAAESREAVQHIGTNAIPLLLRQISYETGGFRSLIERHLPCPVYGPRLASIRKFLTADASKAGDAVMGFYYLGPVARPAIPELTRLALRSEHDRYKYPAALCCIGPDAIPALLTISTNTQGDSTFAISCLEILRTNGLASASGIKAK